MLRKPDFFSFLDQCKDSGVLPDGSNISRGKVTDYINKNKIVFIGHHGHPQRDFSKWIQEWRNLSSYSYDKLDKNVRPWSDKPIENVRLKVDVQKNPLFTDHEQSRNVNINPASKNVHVESRGIDPSINILDDDLDFPEGESEYTPPYELNIVGKILILNDIHIPHHFLPSLRLAINYGREQQVNAIVLNGDTLDFYQLSKFSRKPSKANLRTEIELGQQFLQQLRKLFPSEKIIFKCGNHEVRLHKYIYDKAPELYGIESLSLQELLKLKELRIDFVKSNQIICAGKIRILHGHEFGGGGAINVARTLRLKANQNIIFGHFHRSQSDYANNIDKEVTGAWSVGCLCDLSPEYLPYNQWQHGFGIIELFEDGLFKVNNHKIIDGKVL